MRTLIALLLLCSPVAALDYNVGEVLDYTVGAVESAVPCTNPLCDCADCLCGADCRCGGKVMVCVGQSTATERHYRDWCRTNGWEFHIRDVGDGATDKRPEGWQVGVHRNVWRGRKLIALREVTPVARTVYVEAAPVYVQRPAYVQYPQTRTYAPVYEQPVYHRPSYARQSAPAYRQQSFSGFTGGFSGGMSFGGGDCGPSG